jgi:2-C-methyl-D-erythritol 2,4-cyclodiphosphate synthase
MQPRVATPSACAASARRCAWAAALLLLPTASAFRAELCNPRSTLASTTMRRMGAIAMAAGEPAMRIGHGYDIHRMASREEAGQPVVISGVKFDGTDAPDFELGCVAHSDGDVVYHSVVDAILGALTMPDIGQLFPDNDPRLRGADSEIFMEEAYKRMRGRGYAIGNVDVTLICQKPRVNVRAAAGGPHAARPRLTRALVSRMRRTPRWYTGHARGRAGEGKDDGQPRPPAPH